MPRLRLRVPRWLLWPSLAVLLLTAIGQTAFYLRSEIAAMLPASRPLLHNICIMLSCRVELPKNARLLSIADSDLREDTAHPGLFVLSSTLSNRASYPLAFPLLEVTLTDMQDQPLLRRQLTPTEYLPAGTSLEQGLAAGSDVAIQLYFSTEQIQATGYRVYVSY